MASRHTFPPAARLHSADDFASLRACRRPLRGRFFVIRHIPGRHAGARLGLAVSRKTSKRATVRNRIKRIVRESFRQHRARLPVTDLLVIARSAAAEADNAQLRQELEQHWACLQRESQNKPASPKSDQQNSARADRKAKPT